PLGGARDATLCQQQFQRPQKVQIESLELHAGLIRSDRWFAAAVWKISGTVPRKQAKANIDNGPLHLAHLRVTSYRRHRFARDARAVDVDAGYRRTHLACDGTVAEAHHGEVARNRETRALRLDDDPLGQLVRTAPDDVRPALQPADFGENPAGLPVVRGYRHMPFARPVAAERHPLGDETVPPLPRAGALRRHEVRKRISASAKEARDVAPALLMRKADGHPHRMLGQFPDLDEQAL